MKSIPKFSKFHSAIPLLRNAHNRISLVKSLDWDWDWVVLGKVSVANARRVMSSGVVIVPQEDKQLSCWYYLL